MATTDSNFFEIQRRGYQWNPNSTLDDGISSMLYDADPNAASGSGTPGEQKLVAMPVGSQYIQSNGTLWLKTTMPNTWINLSGGGGSSTHSALTDMPSSSNTDHDGRYPTREEWGENGFENRTDSTLTWTDATPDRTLSIQPVVTDFNYWINGIKYTSTGDTVQITNTEGIHIIYYDGATLTSLANPTTSQMQNLIMTSALVSIVYWDVSASTAIYVGEERHGKIMTPATHSYLHFVNGCVYNWGLGLNNMHVDENGNDNEDAQFGIDVGAVSDEDIYKNIDAVASTTGLPIYYMRGADAEWQKYIQAGFSCRTFDGTTATRLAFNEYTGGAWQLTEETNGDFILMHVFATTEKDTPMISIMGQNGYANKLAAKKGAETEIQNLVLNNILFPEIRPIATIIYQTKLSYANDVNARIVSTDEGDNYVDWRDKYISRTEVTTSDHNTLSGKQGGDGTDFYHLGATDYTAVTTLDTNYLKLDASNSPVTGFLQMTNNIGMRLGNEIRWYDAANVNYVGFKAPSSITTTSIWTLPPADGTAGQILTTDGSLGLGFTDLSTLADGTYLKLDASNDPVTGNLELNKHLLVNGTATIITDLNVNTNTDLGGTLIVGGLSTFESNVHLNEHVELKFFEAGNTNYVGFKGQATLAGNTIWTLPPEDGTVNQVMTTDGAGNLSFESITPSIITGFDWQVKISSDDFTEAYLENKITGSSSMDVTQTIHTTYGEQINLSVDTAWLQTTVEGYDLDYLRLGCSNDPLYEVLEHEGSHWLRYDDGESQSTTTVTWNAYPGLVTSGGDLAVPAGVQRTYFFDAHDYRFRQSGNVTELNLYMTSITGLLNCKVQIWRENAAGTFDLVDATANLTSSLTTGTNVVAVDLDVQKGDFYAIYIQNASAGSVNYLKTATVTVGNTRYRNEESSGNIDWNAQSSVGTVACPIVMEGKPPKVVVLGDSIMAGFIANQFQNNSFIDNRNFTYLENCVARQIERTLGVDVQNYAVGGAKIHLPTTDAYAIGNQALTNIWDEAKALTPKTIVLQGGVNDIIGGGVTPDLYKADVLADYEDMLDDALANDIFVIVVSIIPTSGSTTAQAESIDGWNEDIKTLCDTYTNTVYVDGKKVLGEFRTGGTSGNLWDLKSEYAANTLAYSTSVAFAVGELVTGGTSGATGTVLYDTGTLMTLENVTGLFSLGEAITGSISGSGTVSSLVPFDTLHLSPLGTKVMIDYILEHMGSIDAKGMVKASTMVSPGGLTITDSGLPAQNIIGENIGYYGGRNAVFFGSNVYQNEYGDAVVRSSSTAGSAMISAIVIGAGHGAMYAATGLTDAEVIKLADINDHLTMGWSKNQVNIYKTNQTALRISNAETTGACTSIIRANNSVGVFTDNLDFNGTDYKVYTNAGAGAGKVSAIAVGDGHGAGYAGTGFTTGDTLSSAALAGYQTWGWSDDQVNIYKTDKTGLRISTAETTGKGTILAQNDSVNATILGNNFTATSAYVNTCTHTGSISLITLTEGEFVVYNKTGLTSGDTFSANEKFRVHDDGSVEINTKYTLPNIDGTAGQILSTNGSGVVSWGSGAGFNLTVQDIDGTPTVANVNTIKFTNGSVTDDGSGVVTVTTGGGGSSNVEDGTAAGQMVFWDGSSEYKHTETTEIFWDDTNKRLGLGLTSATMNYRLSFGGDTHAVIGMEQNSSTGKGNNLGILAGEGNGLSQDGGIAYLSGGKPIALGDSYAGIYTYKDVLGTITLFERAMWSNGGVVFNDSGESYDLRVEGDTEDHLLFVDASVDTVGIEESSPDTNVALHIGDDNSVGGFRNDNPPRAKMYLGTPQTNLTANAWTKIRINTDEYDSNSITDTSNNRITPGVAGYYLLIGNVIWQTGFVSGNRMSSKLVKNGTTNIAITQGYASGTSYYSNLISTVTYLTATDYIEMQGRPGTSGNTADIQAGEAATYLVVHRLS